MSSISNIINFKLYDLKDNLFIEKCKKNFIQKGVITLPFFIKKDALEKILVESNSKKSLAYYTKNKHNIYLSDDNLNYSNNHPTNHKVVSSKGCITTDQLDKNSVLRYLYNSNKFKSFVSQITNSRALYEYSDRLSSINIHYANEDQELGWHFDNSSFAITLLIQSPTKGGVFEYVPNLRNKQKKIENYTRVKKILEGLEKPKTLEFNPGTLVLFKGENSIHRVTPVIGEVSRILVVLAYNSEPGISLSEEARKTFYGRLE